MIVVSTGVETLDELVERVRSAAADRRRSVETVEHRSFAVRLSIRGPAVSHRIDLFYGLNHEVTTVQPVGGTLEQVDRELCLAWVRETVQGWSANNRLARLDIDLRPKVSEVLLAASELFGGSPVFLSAGDYNVRLEVNGTAVNVFNNKQGRWTRVIVDQTSPSEDRYPGAATALMNALTGKGGTGRS